MSVFQPAALVLGVSLATTACAGSKAGLDDFSLSDSAVAGYDTAGDSGNIDSMDTAVEIEPTYWTLHASLDLVDGAIQLESSQVVRAIEGQQTDIESNTFCEVTSSLASAQLLEPPDETIFYWWSIQLGDDDSGCDAVAVTIPTLEYLGIGQLHEEIRAILGTTGYASVGDSLYGAYLAMDDESVWTFGIAATDDGFQGLTSAVQKPPLPDGLYFVESLYVLPL